MDFKKGNWGTLEDSVWEDWGAPQGRFSGKPHPGTLDRILSCSDLSGWNQLTLMDQDGPCCMLGMNSYPVLFRHYFEKTL